jgi:death on curing protein
LPNEPRWLEPEIVININRREVAETGEPFAVLDEGALDMALWKPKNLYFYEGEDNAAVLATALLFGIARNHPFQQGNKRTALTAAVLFLRLNGYRMVVPDGNEFADIIIKVITGEASEDVFMRQMAEYGIQPIENP